MAIAGAWPGLDEAGFASGIDAAVNWGNGKAYFFKGGQYVRYDMATDKADPGYPVAIAGAWPGFSQAGFASGIDAAVNWGNGKAYFFKGGQYLRYDMATDKADPGYPVAIAGAWPGFSQVGFGSGIQAVLEYEPWFADGQAVNDYFINTTGQNFIDWFNGTHAKKGYWQNVAVVPGPAVQQRFLTLWSRIPELYGNPYIRLVQFLALMSAIINETGGTITPLSEKVGSAGHPGIAYAFDAIPNVKVSYNASPNRTAFSLFNDASYNSAHGQLALGNVLMKTTDQVWAGKVYPQAQYPTAEDPAQNGYILQADFYKFRGRGLIQTTWRSGYVKLITFVQKYNGVNPKVLQYKMQWSGKTADTVATQSTNGQWDDLFQQSELLVPCVAIAQHNIGGGNYLRLSFDENVLRGTGSGSVYNVGLKLSGSSAYASKFKNRVFQLLDSLPAY